MRYLLFKHLGRPTLTEVPVSARHGAGSAPSLRHAATDEVSADVFLTDPGLALVHADMGAWMEAHPCVCEALCECDTKET